MIWLLNIIDIALPRCSLLLGVYTLFVCGIFAHLGPRISARPPPIVVLSLVVVITPYPCSLMVFFILIGASMFSLVFRGFGGDEVVAHLFDQMPGGVTGALIIVMAVIFLLGFILDFIEITFVVVPIVGPILMAMGVDPIWLGIMIAINLQTSFLTPPFGFALFYLRGVAKDTVKTADIYRGVVPFIVIQIILLLTLAWQPWLATWLPGKLYGA